MRAVVFDRYGPPEVLRVEEIDQPVPKDDEVLVQVHATTVNRTDSGSAGPIRSSRGCSPGPEAEVPDSGIEFAGEVAAVGSSVTEFAVGDDVFGLRGSGANAEYVCVRERGLSPTCRRA